MFPNLLHWEITLLQAYDSVWSADLSGQMFKER